MPGGMTTQTVVGFFDRYADAERALRDLAAAGFGRDRIREFRDESGTGPAVTEHGHHGDPWFDRLIAFLTGGGAPEDEARRYGEGVRGGGIVVGVEADAGDAERAARVLADAGAVDVHDRETTAGAWRSPSVPAPDAAPPASIPAAVRVFGRLA
jgi:hypothetical protein